VTSKKLSTTVNYPLIHFITGMLKYVVCGIP